MYNCCEDRQERRMEKLDQYTVLTVNDVMDILGKEHLHIHFVMNSVNYRDGSKHRGTKEDYYGFIHHINRLLRPYGLLANPTK